MASMEQEPPAVCVDNLDFTYKSTYETKHVLHGLNMTLAPGSRCLLIGANGAGTQLPRFSISIILNCC